MKTKTMMSGTNLIIVAVVLVGGYFVYKKYYTKKTTAPIKPLPIKPLLDDKGNPVLPIKPLLDDKGNPIVPTSSFDSFDDDGL